MTKSLRSTGSEHASRAATRWAMSPWKDLRISEHRQASRASAFVAARDRRRVEIGAQHAARRARLLDLGDDRGPPCAQRGHEIARRRCCCSFKLGEGNPPLGGGDFRPLHLEDALEDGHFLVLLKAMNSSILCFAAPLLMAWLARSMPAFRLGASPAT